MCLAMPGQVVALDDDLRFATVNVSGQQQKVSLALLQHETLQPGDWVLIHVGHAVSKVTEAYAREQLVLLELLADPGSDWDAEVASMLPDPTWEG